MVSVSFTSLPVPFRILICSMEYTLIFIEWGEGGGDQRIILIIGLLFFIIYYWLGHLCRGEHKGDSITNSISSGKGILEPNIDFELDVKVFIDNGKCILYPKEAKEEEFKR